MAGSGRSNAMVLALATVLTTAVAHRVTRVVWTAATGKPTLDQPDDPDNDIKEALAFAVVSGVAAGVVRVLINRQARRFFS